MASAYHNVGLGGIRARVLARSREGHRGAKNGGSRLECQCGLQIASNLLVDLRQRPVQRRYIDLLAVLGLSR